MAKVRLKFRVSVNGNYNKYVIIMMVLYYGIILLYNITFKISTGAYKIRRLFVSFKISLIILV